MRARTVFFAIGVLSLVSALGATPWVEEHTRPPHIPQNLGNWPRIVSPLKAYPEDRPVSFAVVGDTLSSGTFGVLLEELRRRDLDFIVHLGDFVSEPTWEGHAFFLKQMERDLGPGGPPLLLVTGNHDVEPKTFPLSAFESVYGPSSFAFRCGGNLFVIACNALPGKSVEEWKADVERLISERRQGVRRVFVFMHKPPLDPTQSTSHPGAARFQERWGGLGVDYFISGHLHGYGRTQIGRTVVLVSAGGGARFKPSRTGSFHHAVLIRVAGDQVTEEILPVEAHMDIGDKLERALLTQAFPAWTRVFAAMGLRKGTALAWGRPAGSS